MAQLANTVTYHSGTHASLGPGWDVMHVVQKERGRTIGSAVLARDMYGNIIRRIGFFPDQFEQITDEQTLRVCRQCFDDRDRSVAEGRGVVASTERR